MTELKNITSFLDRYLEKEKFSGDDSWNGLQVEGGKEVKKVALSVSAGLDVFKRAKEEGADMIISHHGLFWKKADPSLVAWQKERVSFLLKNNISFYASHLPLDAHPEIGNNAQLMKLLGVRRSEGFAKYGDESIGWIGDCEPVPVKEVVRRLEEGIGADCRVLHHGKNDVHRVAVISGGAPHKLFEVMEKGVDLFITGDPTDLAEVIKDAGMNVIFAGHYATETLGVRALGGVIEEEFGIKSFFIDMPTGL